MQTDHYTVVERDRVLIYFYVSYASADMASTDFLCTVTAVKACAIRDNVAPIVAISMDSGDGHDIGYAVAEKFLPVAEQKHWSQIASYIRDAVMAYHDPEQIRPARTLWLRPVTD